MISEDILYLSIRELAGRIRARKLSPVDLTRAYLERSERLGPKFNAYASLTPERALDQARAAEKEISGGHYRGPLHGIPYAAKDLLAVKGYPTTWGARPYANQKFDADATIIERLDRAGAILIGKAAMIELAGGLGYSNGLASLTGGCRNPWNPQMWTSGSSSGSGAIMAAGLAAFALGSDTRGSIISPATLCGISGMRPSFGRVPRTGVMAIAWSMDKIGPMARTGDCCGLVLSAIAGHDPKDHDSLPPALSAFPYARAKVNRPMRIGRIKNAAGDTNPEINAAVADALKVMEKAGARIEDAEVPDGPYEEAAELVILIEAASAFWDLIRSGRCAELADPLGQINGYASLEFSAFDYLQVQRVRTYLQKKVDGLFDRFDVLAAPGQGSVARPLQPQAPAQPRPVSTGAAGRGTGTGNRPPSNVKQGDGISSLCGLPAITVPCGFSKDRLPIGIQFMARALEDESVIAAADLFQSHTDWHKQHPLIA
jgi:aspartyl-tRNA(Asn)/glutamyl-tRNA(Gln) amidotransferase subunit A